MKEDMRAQRSGIFRFEAVDGADLLLSYNPLGSYDWVLLTLVSSNVISTKLDGYLHQTLFLMVGVIALMVCLILVLFFSWSAHFQTMERAAFIDRVTGAMNENAFRLKCETVLPHAPPGSCSIVLLNIKNFKLLNQQFGSACGNEILCSVMRVLKNWVRGCGYAARADADHFLLCLDTGNPEQIQQKIRQIVMDAAKAVQQLDALKATPIYFVLQPDVYIVDDPTLDFTVILGRAKTACSSRTATEDGVCKFYDHAITARLEKEQALNSLFRSSLENGDFEVYLQPKVRVADEGIGGAEALVRWRHPQHGVIYPSDFIPLFEANGNVCPLDLYVFEGVCKTLRRWRAEGRALFPISVNLSRQHFRNPDCLQAFAAVAEQYEISAGQIEFELTESVFFDDQGIETVKRQIQEMHRLGFGCSLDDFGSGYSSLGLLMEFDVDAIKFDRRFFKDMKNPKLRDLMASLVALSRKMGAQTVAEGIETPEQRALLQEVGCDLIQGYIYARPLPIPEFEAWLDHRS